MVRRKGSYFPLIFPLLKEHFNSFIASLHQETFLTMRTGLSSHCFLVVLETLEVISQHLPTFHTGFHVRNLEHVNVMM